MRHPETPGNAQAGTSRDKGKGTDPRNWGAAGIPDQELDADTQRVLLENVRFSQNEPVALPKKHKKRSKAKEREHRKKSKANKKAKTREEFNEARGTSVYSNASAGVANHIQRIANASKGNTASRLDNLRRIDDNLRPSKQINPHSYLGKALADARANSHQPSVNHKHNSSKGKKRGHKKTSKRSKGKGKRRHGRRKHSPSPSDSSSSDSSSSEDDPDSGHDSNSPSDDSSSSSSDSGSSTTSSTSTAASNDSDYSDSDSESSSSSDSSTGHPSRRRLRPGKTLLKPIPPGKYNGEPNPQLFFQFVRQSLDYVTDGRAPLERQVSIISNFLTDRAYVFYTREASLDPSRWNLDEFFEALFDYCFPPRLQGPATSNEIDMVTKLWYGLNRDIQQQLWLERLNPERSTYNEVLRMAETIEMSNLAAHTSAPQVPRDENNSRNNRRHRDDRDNQNNRRHRSHSRPRTSNPSRNGRRVRFEDSGFRRHGNPIDGTSSSRNFSRQDRRNFDRPRNDPRSSDKRAPSQNRHSLTDQEMERLRAENRCFRCKEVGHTSRHCPTRNNIASSSRNGPPGQRSLNNIEVSAIQQAEDLRQLAETTECEDLIELSMIDYGDYDGDAGYFTHLFDDITLPEPEPTDPGVVSSNDTQSDQDKAINPTGVRLDVRDQGALESLRLDPPMSSIDKVVAWISNFEDTPFLSEGDYYKLKDINTHTFHYSKKDTRAHKYMDHIVDKQREVIGSAKHFWLDRIAQKLLPSKWGLRVLYIPSGDVIYISNDVLCGVITIKTSYIFRWRPQSLARYIARKVYQSVHRSPPKELFDTIDRLGSDLEYFNDPILANAENVLNLAHSHHILEYPDDFIHIVKPPCFSVCTVQSGLWVMIHDHMLKEKYRISRWNLLNEKFNIVNWA
ncbi:hypothetical protein NP233_g11532 [Leucocoprinus birnbaumii]|uniref:CCHC-type domain-containing protein n=1 Tax=Leucocoprinus birnbaumii TaxID=56174 RepID=A0AAD5YQV9_9AGAR|nr:hypothetical protein NP233_g11532 [Leucocoprinus birnbaumii]